jgi:hypothetical protein
LKLSEAKSRISQIEYLLEINNVLLSKGPVSSLQSTLSESSNLVNEKHDLQKRILDTAETVSLEGNTLSDVLSAQESLLSKINILMVVSKRTDLSDDTYQALHNQLRTWIKTKNDLDIRINKCICETDLIT